MRLLRDSFSHRLIRWAAHLALRKVEHLDNADMRTNGELAFLREFAGHFADHGREITVVDGGANIGAYLSAALDEARAAGLRIEIHAFEPASGAYRSLHARYSSNPGVKLNNCGLSDADEEAEVFLDRDGSPFASLYRRDLRAVGLRLDISEPVRLRRLDGYLQQCGVGHLHLLKLDVEGAEYRALQGMGKLLDPAFVDFVQFEYGGTNLDAGVSLKALFDLFERAGFVVARLMPRGLRLLAYGPWMDNYAYANYVAISGKTYERLLASD